MSGYQFIHLECYARVAGKTKTAAHTVDSIINEAERVPSACPHITNPELPIIVYDVTVSPRDVAVMAKKWADNAKDVSGRKLRKDGLCLLAGVVSLPREREADWPEFREAAIKWLKKEYGVNLKSVVEHIDESHPHLHFYVVPNAGQRFDDLHAGRRAAAAANAAGEIKGKQNDAYKAAMREFQTKFHTDVAQKHGLARLGPKRRRLTRGEWQAEQVAAGALGDALSVRDDALAGKQPKSPHLAEIQVRILKRDLAKTETELDEALDTVDRLQDAAELISMLKPSEIQMLKSRRHNKQKPEKQNGREDSPNLDV